MGDGAGSELGALRLRVAELERTLRKVEEEAANIHRDIPIGIYRTSPDGRILAANPALVRMLGFSGFEELASRDLEHEGFEPPSARARFKEKVEADGEVRGLESAWRRRDGTLIYVRENARAVKGDGGKVLYYEGSAEDISQWKRLELALRESEERFRKTFEDGPLGMALSDMEYRFFRTNPKFCSILGYTEAELSAMTFKDITHPAHLENDIENVKRLDSGEFPFFCTEKRYIRKDGTVIWGEVTVSRLADSDGRTACHLVMLQDITDRKRMELALQASEARYRSLVDLVPIAIVVAEGDGNVALVNKAALEVFACGENEMVGNGIDRFLPGLSGAVSDAGPGEPAGGSSGRGRQGLPGTGRRNDNTEFPLEYSVARWEAEGRRYLCVIAADVTERRGAEDSLRESAERYRALFDNSPAGVVLLDSEGFVRSLNDAALGILRVSRQQALGQHFGAFGNLPGEDLGRYFELMNRLLSGNVPQPVELRVEAGGQYRWVEVYPARLENGGRLSMVQVILLDITDKKRTQLEMMGRLMKYDLFEGNIYLVKEPTPLLSREGLHDALRAGYRGIVLTREPRLHLKLEPGLTLAHIWLAERRSEGALPPDPARVEEWAAGLPRNQAVLIERLDYLASKNGFGAVLDLVRRLREIAYLGGHIFIVSLDPALVSPHDLHALEKEALEIQLRAKPHVPDDLMDIMKYIYERGAAGTKPSLSELARGLRLSRPTIRKKLRRLSSGGYLVLGERGRVKTAELTEKGRHLFV